MLYFTFFLFLINYLPICFNNKRLNLKKKKKKNTFLFNSYFILLIYTFNNIN